MQMCSEHCIRSFLKVNLTIKQQLHQNCLSENIGKMEIMIVLPLKGKKKSKENTSACRKEKRQEISLVLRKEYKGHSNEIWGY